MIASTTLQSKILRTKKRLSSNLWNLPQIILASMGLMVILSFLLRSISVAGIYGLVPAEIPVLPVSIEDESYANYKESVTTNLDVNTPLVLLTEEHLIFGSVEAFTNNLSSVRNKFLVPHVDGAPNMKHLMQDLEKWMFVRMSQQKLENNGILIFLPTANIPSPIVIQVIAGLRGSKMFDRVILAGGLI